MGLVHCYSLAKLLAAARVEGTLQSNVLCFLSISYRIQVRLPGQPAAPGLLSTRGRAGHVLSLPEALASKGVSSFWIPDALYFGETKRETHKKFQVLTKDQSAKHLKMSCMKVAERAE